MARFNRLTSGSRRSREEDTELNIVPIMNMFMVLIPFLLMSASFFQIKAINTSVAVHSNSPKSENSSPPEKVMHKLTVILELKEDLIKVSALSDTLEPGVLADLETEFTRTAGQALSVTSIAEHLKKLKTQYPLSDTMLLIPDADVSYNEIIQAMDCARKYHEAALFPNVVLSASLG
jgi:biopolymer transport protein ExbD